MYRRSSVRGGHQKVLGLIHRDFVISPIFHAQSNKNNCFFSEKLISFKVVNCLAQVSEIRNSLHIQRGDTFGADPSPGQQLLAKQILMWKWLIIDEISMVSARFLAEIDVRLRCAARSIGTMKRDEDHYERPFGGLNVIFAGDFWQLDPPEPAGWPLTRVPCDLHNAMPQPKNSAVPEYGLSLFWGNDPREAVQGVSELEQQMRVEDSWYCEVLDECRQMKLSENSYNFIHGNPTTVPGSWEGGAPKCGREHCKSLAGRESPTQILLMECALCKKERASKVLVAQGPDDPRFSLAFQAAPLIVPSNGVRTHTNKRGH